MSTRSIDIMLSRPGVYVVCGAAAVVLVEVVEGGRCYQLEPDKLQRSGELHPGGWHLESIAIIHGPFTGVSVVKAGEPS